MTVKDFIGRLDHVKEDIQRFELINQSLLWTYLIFLDFLLLLLVILFLYLSLLSLFVFFTISIFGFLFTFTVMAIFEVFVIWAEMASCW